MIVFWNRLLVLLTGIKKKKKKRTYVWYGVGLSRWVHRTRARWCFEFSWALDMVHGL